MDDERRYETTARTQVHRLKDRASYDRAVVHAILDEALVCHVGFAVDGQVFVLPTTYARVGELVYIHGAAASRMLKVLREGISVCVTVTILDGLVLARSAFHHSMNYRSVALLGRATDVTDLEEKEKALSAIVEHVSPGRMKVARPPNSKELAATRVLALPLEEVSAKTRSGGPLDDEADLALDVWAGEIPLKMMRMDAIAHR